MSDVARRAGGLGRLDWSRVLPPLLFGLRLTAAVASALFVAFWLQLDNPSWAGTSAAIVCQPVLGASLRKGVFRLVGTVIGAVATVLLTAAFPQERAGFLISMALWCAACSFVSTLLRNFAAYAAMLSGYTMVIIASSSIAEPDQVFILALSRATEICLGIVCGMVIMSLTDAGRSSRRLAATFAGLAAEIGEGAASQLHRQGAPDAEFRTRRRDLIKRVAALDPLLDQAIGESPVLGERRSTVRAGINGLFLALSAWRSLGLHLERLPAEEAERQAQALWALLPPEPGFRLDLPTAERSGLDESAGPAVHARDVWFDAARDARHWSADAPSLRLGADRIASLLEGLGRASNTMVLLTQPKRALLVTAVPRDFLPDVLPPLVNALRVFVAIGLGCWFYVATSWPSGLTFITFLAVTVLLLSPQDEQAYAAAVKFGLGMVITAVVAGVFKFAILPNHETYLSFTIILGLALVPMGALSTQPALAPVFVAAAANFIPLLGPTNTISYDTISFYNTALAIVGGSVAGAVVMRAMPPVPRRMRTARLLALTLRDLRGLLRRPRRWVPDRWRSRIFGRLMAMPPDADLVEGSRLLAALTLGLQFLDLGTSEAETGRGRAHLLEAATALSEGDVHRARIALKALKDALGEAGADQLDPARRLRMQGAAREMSETLQHYADYFGAEIR
ncbi:FUSC family protein [Lichenifustis flavocetrariae]|uniref:FUSC family protein n=1 Tax=Lichenifustis flavocetrariae TaxID=2949735 RepID=A0AA41YZI5_9HYPH|nr:FUSC family protein [Lichenifustis flavocetrariae]MCW6509973.1 FUSC family protein [Lichenifustis flavocetrariae]